MAVDDNSSSGFKVVDRRPFAADGSRNQNVRAEERESEAAPQPERTRGRATRPEGRGQDNEDSSGFDTLVSYLSTTAMFQLGLIPGPSGEHIPSDFPSAKRTIDLLEVLQEKTQRQSHRQRIPTA